MKVLTCNIRCFSAEDGDNNWTHRKDFCIDLIKSQAADIICFQEMQIEHDVSPELTEYQSYGMVDQIDGRHQLNSIFFRSDMFTLISASGYWLSEHPHITGSKSWDSRCVRIANWVRLENRSTGAEFRVINTHLDHISQLARENQAAVIVEDSSAYPQDYPQILTGDMNCDTQNAAIGVFKKGGWSDTYEQIHGLEEPGHTFHSFHGPEYKGDIGKMDWIFSRGTLNVTDAEIIKDSADGRFPSDHYFVSTTLQIS